MTTVRTSPTLQPPLRPPDVTHVMNDTRPSAFFANLLHPCIIVNGTEKWGRPGNEASIWHRTKRDLPTEIKTADLSTYRNFTNCHQAHFRVTCVGLGTRLGTNNLAQLRHSKVSCYGGPSLVPRPTERKGLGK